MVLPYIGTSSALLAKNKFSEEMYDAHPMDFDRPAPTGYPSPDSRHRLIYESANLYIEETYFWLLEQLSIDWAYTQVYKICDIFAASEQSSFFAVSEQRLGLQQDKASAYLKGISEMVKALFQIVREIRIIEERLFYYEDSFSRKTPNEAKSSEITLKGIWTDQVEGGVKNASSVFGLSQTVGFTVLPDLFFRVEIDDAEMNSFINKKKDDGSLEFIGDWANFDKASREMPEKIDKKIGDKDFQFNEKIREILKRKLVQYYTWKHRTYKELVIRRRFTIKYLRQHYDTIKLYMGWVKPYLRHIKRLQLASKQGISAETSPELLAGFEGSLVEVEVLLHRYSFTERESSRQNYFPCILLHFVYRTRPQEAYVGEGYSRGPAHIGRVDITWRGYVWSQDTIKKYLAMREEEDLELLSGVNTSIQDAMDALGDDLKKYLEEANEKFPRVEKKPDKPKLPTVGEPFSALVDGLKEMFGMFVKLPDFKQKKGFDEMQLSDEWGAQRAWMRLSLYQSYKNFKKKHGLTAW